MLIPAFTLELNNPILRGLVSPAVTAESRALAAPPSGRPTLGATRRSPPATRAAAARAGPAPTARRRPLRRPRSASLTASTRR